MPDLSRQQFTQLRLGCTLVAVAAVLGAVLLMLLPLPTQNTGLFDGPLYCGPGATSDNALQIMLDPAAVNRHPAAPTVGTPSDAERQARAQREAYNVQICQTAAKGRFIPAAIALILAVAVGLAIPSVLRPKRKSTDTDLHTGV